MTDENPATVRWWDNVCGWAPCSGHIVWSRKMDWIALAVLDDGVDTLDDAADAIGVDRETVMRRIDVLLEAAGGKI